MGTIANRMKQDLARAGLAEITQKHYLADARALVAHFRRPPAELTQDDLRQYLTILEGRPIGVSRVQRHLAAIKLLFTRTLGQPEKVAWISFPSPPKRLPRILAQDQVKALLEALELPVLRVIVMVLYATGLRISEACSLKVTDIDSKRMVVRTVGKGNKERLTVLSPVLLGVLRSYWLAERPALPYLFTNKRSKLGRPVSPDKVQQAVRVARQLAGIKTAVTPHLLRHSFATHLHEAGTELSVIQHLLGHANIRTTTRYAQVSTRMIQAVKSPLDSLQLPVV
jgi:integrase/recombinase XerD